MLKKIPAYLISVVLPCATDDAIDNLLVYTPQNTGALRFMIKEILRKTSEGTDIYTIIHNILPGIQYNEILNLYQRFGSHLAMHDVKQEIEIVCNSLDILYSLSHEVVKFGKYQGNTFADVATHYREYLIWLMKQTNCSADMLALMKYYETRNRMEAILNEKM